MSLFGAIGSLVGGLFGQSSAKKAAARERAWALEDQAEQFVRLREAAVKGGFNPAAVLGAAPNAGMVNPTQADRSNAFGQAIADAGLLYDQSRARTQEVEAQKEANSLRIQNARLQKMVVKEKLRPPTPGIYERDAQNEEGLEGRKAVGQRLVSFGEETRVPTGPDVDEVVSGFVIDTINKGKARDTQRKFLDAIGVKSKRSADFWGTPYVEGFTLGPQPNVKRRLVSQSRKRVADAAFGGGGGSGAR